MHPDLTHRPLTTAALRWVAVVVGLLLLLPAGAMAQARDTGLGIALVGGPLDRADDPVLGREIFDTAPPGIRRTWQLRVANDTPEPMDLVVFVADVTRTSQGRSISLGPTEGPLREWISFSDDAFTLGARETTIVDVVIMPPPDADRLSFEAAIVVSPVIRPAEDGIQSIGRVAMPLFLTTDDAFVGADFEIISIGAGRADDGRPLVDVTVRNTGGRTVSLIGVLDLLDGPSGLQALQQIAANSSTLEPGDEGVLRFFLDATLPAGPWRAFVVVSGGNVERAADATVTFPTEPGTNAAPLPATPRSIEEQRRILIPIAATLVVTVLSILAVLGWGAHRARRPQAGGGGDGVANPAENDVNAVE